MISHLILASAHHPESWNPNWNLRTLVMSLRGFMTTQPREIGSISSDATTQKRLALLSKHFKCPICNVLHSRLTPVKDRGKSIDPAPSGSFSVSLMILKVLTSLWMI